MSALRQTSELISAPAARYASSEKFAASPAPDSTATRKPSLISFSTTSGTVATRFSPAKVSRGTPISCDMDSPDAKARILPRHQSPLDQLEHGMHHEREQRRGQRA